MALLIILVIAITVIAFIERLFLHSSRELGLVPVRSDIPPNNQQKKEYHK